MATSQQGAAGTGQRGDRTQRQTLRRWAPAIALRVAGNPAQPARPDALCSQEKGQDWRWQVDRGKTAPLTDGDHLGRLTVGHDALAWLGAVAPRHRFSVAIARCWSLTAGRLGLPANYRRC